MRTIYDEDILKELWEKYKLQLSPWQTGERYTVLLMEESYMCWDYFEPIEDLLGLEFVTVLKYNRILFKKHVHIIN